MYTSPHLLRAPILNTSSIQLPRSRPWLYAVFPTHATFGLLTILVLSVLSGTAFAAPQAGSPAVAARIVTAVDETKMITLAHSTHRLAVPQYDQGAVEDSMPMEHMLLQLRRSPEQEAALERTIDELQDPHSGTYHQWLTADEWVRNSGLHSRISKLFPNG